MCEPKVARHRASLGVAFFFASLKFFDDVGGFLFLIFMWAWVEGIICHMGITEYSSKRTTAVYRKLCTTEKPT